MTASFPPGEALFPVCAVAPGGDAFLVTMEVTQTLSGVGWTFVDAAWNPTPPAPSAAATQLCHSAIAAAGVPTVAGCFDAGAALSPGK